jgi:hypothetical protein
LTRRRQNGISDLKRGAMHICVSLFIFHFTTPQSSLAPCSRMTVDSIIIYFDAHERGAREGIVLCAFESEIALVYNKISPRKLIRLTGDEQ